MIINRRKIKAVIFDMDGLMFDTEKLAEKCWESAGAKFGYNIERKIYKQITGLNIKKAKEIFLDHFGKDFPFDEIRAERIKTANETIKAEGVPLKNGLFELLKYLKNKKLETGLATSTEQSRAELLLDLSDAKKYFNAITYGDSVINGKPDPEIFLTTAEKLNVNPENCIVLEDSRHGIEAAFNAGMLPFMVPDTIEPDKSIKDKVFKIFDSLNDVRIYLQSLIS
ncbi:MAG: HAD family phosphatase [Spirochaetes bacterium]|nr:HAD family phosphatase [Spirochaetota bacterium]